MKKQEGTRGHLHLHEPFSDGKAGSSVRFHSPSRQPPSIPLPFAGTWTPRGIFEMASCEGEEPLGPRQAMQESHTGVPRWDMDIPASWIQRSIIQLSRPILGCRNHDHRDRGYGALCNRSARFRGCGYDSFGTWPSYRVPMQSIYRPLSVMLTPSTRFRLLGVGRATTSLQPRHPPWTRTV